MRTQSKQLLTLIAQPCPLGFCWFFLFFCFYIFFFQLFLCFVFKDPFYLAYVQSYKSKLNSICNILVAEQQVALLYYAANAHTLVL